MSPTFRRWIQRPFTIIMRTVAAICLATLAYIAAGEIGGRITVNTDFVEPPAGVEIFVTSNGIHTDIVVPAVSATIDWTSQFDPTTFESPLTREQVTMIAFGWGERSLYEKVPTWPDLTLGIAANALLWPTQSAMHVTYYRNQPALTPLVRRVVISEDQYRTLVQFIEDSFIRDAGGGPVNMNCCWYPAISDNFFRSTKQYHILRTCNNWTNTALRVAGIRTALWTPFHDRILEQLDPFNPQVGDFDPGVEP